MHEGSREKGNRTAGAGAVMHKKQGITADFCKA